MVVIRILIFIFASFFIMVPSLAQIGVPILSHYRESREIEDQSWAICQDEDLIMLFANRHGILTYDGQEWNSIEMSTIPYVLKYREENKRVYVGGDNDYGYLEKDDKGLYNYYSLVEDWEGLGVITRIIFTDTTVYFYGEQSIYRHDLRNHLLEKRFTMKGNNPFTGMFVTSKNTFINVYSKGLHRLDSDTLFPIVTGYLLENDEVLFNLPYDDKLVLLGISNGDLSLFDGMKFYDYEINDDGYLSQNILSEGLAISDSLYVFSTLDGGALVVNRKNRKIRNTINYQNGLPDDEIFGLGADNNGGLWLSHQYGLTRADLSLPVGDFSIYPGLKGNLTTSAWNNSEIYAGTSEGVFYLAEVVDYLNYEILVKKEPEITVTPGETQSEKTQDQEKSRNRIFTRIFRRPTDAEKDKTPVLTTDKQTATVKTKPEDQYIRKTVRRIKSVRYVYEKVEGLNEKCRQLVTTSHGLLAATNRGLYTITNHRAEIITDNRYINYISWRPYNNKYFVAAGDGFFTVSFLDGKWIIESPDKEYSASVYSVLMTDGDTLWLGCDNKIQKAATDEGRITGGYSVLGIDADIPLRYKIDNVNDSVFLLTSSGIYFFDNKSGRFSIYKPEPEESETRIKYTFPLSNLPLFKADDDWISLATDNQVADMELSLLKIFDEVVSISADSNYLWIIDGENHLYRIDRYKSAVIKPEIDVFVKSVSNERGKVFSLSDIVLDPGENMLNFKIVAPGYLKQSTTQYQYIVEKLMPDWSPWSVNSEYSLIRPKPGDYTLKVRAKDLWGNIGEPKIIQFTIKAPFTRTTGFYLFSGLAALLAISYVVQLRERQLQKKNRILEDKVKERTAEIEAQKEEITSSIAYASRIQMAMLPANDLFKYVFPDYFILFKPRDIVSGDFYWIGEDEKHIFFTVADCTGHGVPGAFMSTLGISALNEIITNYKDLKASMVLNLLREKTKTSLHQTGKEGEATDGMDLAFCVLHKNRRLLEYAGAYNPLFIVHGGELKEYKGDRMPIGIHYGEKESFTNHEIKVKKGDVIYIFSDGFSDQFGGSEGGKYKKFNLKKLLAKICHKSMGEQLTILEDEFQKWKGDSDQVDDVTIIGVRL
jgi:serine phosphatase RsbU (regulator of sigma subunit)